MEAQVIRRLDPGTAYDALFAGVSEGRNRTIGKAGIEHTIQLVMRVARKYAFQTAQLAPTLRRATLDDTLRAIWQFVYQHIQYRLDEPGREQVRRPARTWADRTRGVDCEDYAVFISSILLNLRIAHKLRISAYARDWQHIYVVVPKEGVPLSRELALDQSDYHVLDDVTERYDYEVPPTKKRDYTMSLEELSGLGGFEADYPAYDLSGTSDPIIADVLQNADGHIVLVDQQGNLYPTEMAGFGSIFSKAGSFLKSTASKVASVGTKVADFPLKVVDKIPGGSAAANALITGATGGLVTYDTVQTVRGAVSQGVQSMLSKPSSQPQAQPQYADMAPMQPTPTQMSAPQAATPMQEQQQYMPQQRAAVATTSNTPPPPGSEDKWYSNPAVIAGGAVVVLGGLFLALRPAAPRAGLSGLPRRRKATRTAKAAPKTASKGGSQKRAKNPTTFRSTPLR